MIELIKALAEVKKSLNPVAKDRKGQLFKGAPAISWCSLEAIQEYVTPLLAQNGLVITHQLEESGRSLKTSIWHTSGESISSSFPLVTNVDQKQYGAQLTYAKRYQVLCLLDLPTTENKPASTVGVGFETYTTISEKQAGDLVALAKSRGLTTPPVVQQFCRDVTGINLETVRQIPTSKYQEVVRALTALEVPAPTAPAPVVDPNTGDLVLE
jgi:hypothetical protein